MSEDSTRGRPRTIGPAQWAEWASSAGDGPPSGIDALATLVALRREHGDRRRRRQSGPAAQGAPPSVLVVALAGPVAVGKSTIATALAARLASAPFVLDTAVVSTDGFLHPNAVLEAEGLMLRKGFPESYDLHRLRQLFRALRRGDEQVTVPVYSHEVYDVAAEPRVLDRPEVLVLEGVNALQGAPDGGPGPGDLADVAVYIDVGEETVADWFCDRFVALTVEARQDASSFYRSWSDLPDDEIRRAAREVWDAINAVNLREHIEPSRARADIELVKAESHEITALRVRSG